MKKFLIIRFSSIGDIVLTTPVPRCIKKKFPDAEIHFLTKSSFVGLVNNLPYIDKTWGIKDDLDLTIEELKKENFDFIVDLHKNLRSKKVIRKLRIPNSCFDKLNIKKWLLTNFKMNKMPDVHIVDRYLETVKHLGVINDNKGLDFIINSSDIIQPIYQNYCVFVVGAAHPTKALTVEKSAEVINKINKPVILIGGPDDKVKSDLIMNLVLKQDVENKCGQLSIGQSASIMEQSSIVITPDTGMMHIAAALNKPIVSIWGNTVPEFGMYAYEPQNQENVQIIEVNDLSCRPCSKIGFEKCPKKHFKCINEIDSSIVVKAITNDVN